MAGLADLTYEPAPEVGGYRFNIPGQPPRLMFGQPAEELRSRVDAIQAGLAAQRDLRTAEVTRTQVAPGSRSVRINQTPPAVLDAKPVMPAGDPVVTGQAAPWAQGLNEWAPKADALAPTQTASAQAAPKPAATEGVPPMIARPPPPGSGFIWNPAGWYENAAGQRFKSLGGGGRPAVTQEMLEAQAAQAVGIPTAASVTTEGGYPVNEEYMQKQRAIALERQRQNVEFTGEMLELRKQQAQQNREFVAQNAAQQKEALDAQAEIERRNAADRDFMLQTREAFRTANVDPERIFADGGGLRGIGMALGAAFGAAGAALAGGQNTAMGVINMLIENDIRAQEAEIKVLGASADNALAQFNKSTGDMNQSKALLRTVAYEQADLKRQELADIIGTAQAKQQSEALRLQIEEQLNGNEEAYLRGSAPKNTAHVTKQMAYPKAATRGSGPVPLTFEENLKATETERKGVETKANVLETGSKVLKNKAEAASGGSAVPTERTDKISAYVNAIGAAGKVEAALAGKSGEFDDPTSGPLDSWSITQESGKFKNELNAATLALAAGAQAKRGKSDKDAELAMQDAMGNGSVGERLRGAQSVRQSAIQGLISEIATLPPAQQTKILETLGPAERDQVLKEMSK